MRILLMKKFDAIIGRLAVALLATPVPGTLPAKVTSILLIRPGGIGDAVHLIPAINAIKAAYPHTAIDVLAEKRNSAVFSLCPHVRTLLHYDKPADLLRTLRGRYDVVIDTEQWHRLSAVVARLIHSPLSIGYATNERSRLFTHQIGYSHDEYEMHSFQRLLDPLGIEPQPVPECFLQIPAHAAKKAAAALIAPFTEKPFIVLFPGASIAERRWGLERFRRLTELLNGLEIRVVVVGGKEDRAVGDMIVSGGAGMNLAGQTSLVETAAIIAKSALLVSGDSGVLHIAVGVGCPTVSLFGPGRAKKWAPRGEKHSVINKKITCSPCTTYGTTPACPADVRCMKEIDVEEVFNAVTMLLTSTRVMASLCCKREWIEVG
ncbi:MAG: heptosyltransferase [Geobacteraceae bacterium GWC2_48_7]|nr:MAG: heptosyltransferase [Geobacteraceae bacterium GWC2_48_7]